MSEDSIIYVDEIRRVAPNKNWPFNHASHLCCIPHDDKKLHAFAESIGLKRRWFQDRKKFPHYDLTPAKRKQAIENGANDSLSFMNIVRMNEEYLKSTRHCYVCFSTQKELRPYGKDSQDICHPCLVSDPEREQEGKKQFGQLLEISRIAGGGIATITGDGVSIGIDFGDKL